MAWDGRGCGRGRAADGGLTGNGVKASKLWVRGSFGVYYHGGV